MDYVFNYQKSTLEIFLISLLPDDENKNLIPRLAHWQSRMLGVFFKYLVCMYLYLCKGG